MVDGVSLMLLLLRSFSLREVVRGLWQASSSACPRSDCSLRAAYLLWCHARVSHPWLRLLHKLFCGFQVLFDSRLYGFYPCFMCMPCKVVAFFQLKYPVCKPLPRAIDNILKVCL